MTRPDIETAFRRLRHEMAGARVSAAGRRLHRLLKENPYWHLQPRVPAGDPDAGQWLPSGPLAPESALPVIARGAKLLFDALRAIGRRVSPELRRVPRRWDELEVLPTDDNFPELAKRKGPATARRPGHPAMRFRSEDELRRFLGPAGPGREWHHLVEQRMAAKFSPEIIHNTDNIINLPLELHQEISKRMSQRGYDTEMVVRRYYIERWSFRDQYNYGIDMIIDAAKDLGYDIDKL